MSQLHYFNYFDGLFDIYPLHICELAHYRFDVLKEEGNELIHK